MAACDSMSDFHLSMSSLSIPAYRSRSPCSRCSWRSKSRCSISQNLPCCPAAQAARAAGFGVDVHREHHELVDEAHLVGMRREHGVDHGHGGATVRALEVGELDDVTGAPSGPFGASPASGSVLTARRVEALLVRVLDVRVGHPGAHGVRRRTWRLARTRRTCASRARTARRAPGCRARRDELRDERAEVVPLARGHRAGVDAGEHDVLRLGARLRRAAAGRRAVGARILAAGERCERRSRARGRRGRSARRGHV